MSNLISFPTPSAGPATDRIEALRARDPRAITDAYRELGGRVRGYARRMLQDDDLAEDVVHDVFVALPDALLGFRGDAQLSTFVIGIAVNVCRRRLRSRARGLRAVHRLHAQNVPPDVPTPESKVRDRQLAAALEEGMGLLSVEHREVVVLSAIEGRTSPEVAEVLGIPEGTVRTRLMTARRKLGEHLRAAGLR